MRIFLTGATGYIGSAVLDAMLRAGHDVTALVRDPEKAERVALRGVQPVIGELSKPASFAGSTGKSRAGRMSTPVRSRTVASGVIVTTLLLDLPLITSLMFMCSAPS